MPTTADLCICIIGTHGNMGTMFVDAWSKKISKINRLDRRQGQQKLLLKDIEANLSQADLVLLCVPATALEQTLQIISPYMDKKTILADITSVKIIPMQLMEKYHSGPTVGTHPLFGPMPAEILTGEKCPPENTSQDKYNVVIVPGANTDYNHISLVENLFKTINCTTFLATAQEHDQAVAVIQALNFIDSLAYFTTAANIHNLQKYITPSFRRRMKAAQKFMHEDAELFTTIAKNNPALINSIKEYTANLKKLEGLNNETVIEMLDNARKCYKN